MKKNDKLLILFILGIIFLLFTWFIGSGTYNNGEFSVGDMSRAGIFDYILVLFYAIYYKASDLFYLFILGGVYGVLSQTKLYRKLVSNTVKLIKKKEIIAFLIITLITGGIVSISKQVLPMLIFVPFIITIFLKRGKDRLTAISAAFGGIFIGTIGLTFGTYGLNQWITTSQISIKDGIISKLIVFIIAYLLYNLFAIIHIKKNKEMVNETNYDMFTTVKIDETKISKNKRQKTWPIIIIFSLIGILAVLAYIDWNNSFDITLFSNIYADLESTQVAGVSIMSFFGSFNALGEWNDLLPLSCILLIGSIIIGLIDRMKVNEYIDNFSEGMKKISKVAVTYILAMTMFIFCYYFNWPATFINKLFGEGNFNIFILLPIFIICSLFYVDNEYVGYIFGDYLKNTYSSQLLGISLLMQFGYGISSVIVPSSAILMIALSYLDIPYTKWIKYIWKFVISMLIVTLIVVGITTK